MDWGSIRARLSQAASGLDQRIAAEAAARAEGNRGAGIERNRQFVMGQQPATAAARISAEAHGGFAGGSLEKLLSGNRGRIGEIANHYAPQMRRGPMATSQMGVMEAINSGIANNPIARRVVLPTAVAGGGLMAGAGVTAGAQKLYELMAFMRLGQESEERTAQSPLIQQA
jgi:hypothetical protein